MARQTNIVSFDAARSASASRRGAYSDVDLGIRASADPARSSTRTSRSSDRSQSSSSSRSASSATRTSSYGRSSSRANGDVRGLSTGMDRSYSRSRRRNTPVRESNVRSGAYLRTQSDNRTSSHAPGRLSRMLFALKARFARRTETRFSARAAYREDSYDSYESYDDDSYSARESRGRSSRSARESRSSKRERQNKQRLRARAEKLFNKQFGGRNESSSEGSPRAAVYRGEMGKNQRRAARMVPAREFVGAATAKLNPFTWFANFSVPASKLIAATVVICVVAASVTLYGPVQQYYQSVRENDRLQVQYAALEERSAQLDAQHDTLTSEAGIETIAHENYGWVKPGEETAWVEGLSDDVYNDKEVASNIAANVDINSIGYPETWYSPFLDFVFDVH